MKKKVLLFGIITAVIVALATVIISTAVNTNKSDDNGEPEETSTVVSTGDNGVAYLNKDATVDEITRTEGAVNIYMFWGNGCPHCKAQWETLEALRKEYPGDFKVYGFEVWNNQKNLELLYKFGEVMGDDVNAVPYTIIGDKSHTGSMKEKEIVEAIKTYKDQKVDIYFDKVKK